MNDFYFPAPIEEGSRRDRIALLCIGNSGLKQRGKGELAKTLMQVAPGRGSAGNRYREPSTPWHLCMAALTHLRECEGCRSAPRPIEAVQHLPIPDQCEEVTANIARGWLNDGEGDCRGQGGIYSVSSLFESGEACLGR